MGTGSENKNVEEKLESTHPLLSRETVKNVVGLPAKTIYPVTDASFTARQNLEDNNNALRPYGLTFDPYISNAKAASGITDFTTYNNYIHPVGDALKVWNVYASLQQAAIQWQVYSRTYR
jgi:hypothetical protein